MAKKKGVVKPRKVTELARVVLAVAVTAQSRPGQSPATAQTRHSHSPVTARTQSRTWPMLCSRLQSVSASNVSPPANGHVSSYP